MLRLASSEKYPIPLPPGHRFPFRKYELVRQQLEYEGVIRPSQVIDPDFISDAEIGWTHCPVFWARAKALELTDKEIRAIGFPRCEELILRSHSSASGTVRAAEWALEDGAGMNLAGGTHHAFFDRGEGFCLLNDVAIAANVLLQRNLIGKALVIDLDVHQGNGTAALFQHDSRVYTLSVHCGANYPFRKEQSDWDIEVAIGTDDDTYMALLEKVLPPLLEAQKPDIVFYIAGVDVLGSDQLGKLSLTPQGCFRRDQYVVRQCKSLHLPLVVVMGGGYSPTLNTVVRAHCNTYKAVIQDYEHSFFRFS